MRNGRGNCCFLKSKSKCDFLLLQPASIATFPQLFSLPFHFGAYNSHSLTDDHQLSWPVIIINNTTRHFDVIQKLSECVFFLGAIEELYGKSMTCFVPSTLFPGSWNKVDSHDSLEDLILRAGIDSDNVFRVWMIEEGEEWLSPRLIH